MAPIRIGVNMNGSLELAQGEDEIYHSVFEVEGNFVYEASIVEDEDEEGDQTQG